jgi:hypothetical protein
MKPKPKTLNSTPNNSSLPDTLAADTQVAKPLTGPNRFNDETLTQALQRIADGMSLRQIEELPGMPSRDTLRRWQADGSAETQARFARAREMSADVFFEQSLEIADTLPALAEGKVDAGYVQWQRLRIDTRRWVASKLAPKKYGDKIEMNHTATAVTVTAADVREMLGKSPLMVRFRNAQAVDVQSQQLDQPGKAESA